MIQTDRKQQNGSGYFPKVRERAIRLGIAHRDTYHALWKAMKAIAPKFGAIAKTLHGRNRATECDTGQRPGLSSDERQQIMALEREVRKRRHANERLPNASALFALAQRGRRFKP